MTHEIIRNHLAIAQNAKNIDAVIVARTIKELNRLRGNPEVDAYFERELVLQKHKALRARILALKK